MKCEFGINKEVVGAIMDGESARKKLSGATPETMAELGKRVNCGSELKRTTGEALMELLAEQLTEATDLKLTLLAEEM